MGNKINPIILIILLLLGGFVGFVTFESDVVQGTNVSGIIYDGSGGPWTKTGSPYVVVGDVIVPSSETLTIEPGVQVKFDDFYSIYVDGSFIAVGTESDWINFSSNMISPAQGDWSSIQINSSGHAEIKYCNISYASYAIIIYSSSNNLINNTLWANNRGIDIISSSFNIITNNSMYSISAPCISLTSSSSENTIKNNNFSNSSMGLYIKDSSDNTITNNNVSNNFGGIYITNSLNITIKNNVFTNDGIYFYGDQLTHFNSHNIPENNVINGNPLLYYKDINNFNIDGIPVGQIILSNCSNIEVRGIQITNIECGIQVYYSTDIILANNDISFNDLDGIRFIESSDNIIMENNVTNNSKGIYLIASSNNIIARNNVIDNNQSGGSGIYLGSSSNNNNITDNIVCENLKGIGISESSSNNTVITNSIVNNNIFGIVLSFSASENFIERNIISLNNDIGVYIKSANFNLIRSNNISYSDYGLYVISSSYSNIITDNNISNNANGSFFEFSSNNSFINNIITNNDDGINLRDSSNNEINGNTINSNNYNGIINWMSSNNISNNEIFDNFYGIQIAQGSENTTVKCNNIFDNEYGIYVGWTLYKNLVYHNNIINNTNQAYDETMAKTFWDNGYPQGGNFWSDYTGIDLNSTPNQDVPPSDGIGDTPYIDIIGGFSPSDNYPLMYPWVCKWQLYNGWNLISIPRIQSDTDLESVLSSIQGYYDAVQYYNSSDTVDHWKHNHILKSSDLNDLSDINHTRGFWIHITEPDGVVLEYDGLPIRQNQSIPLHVGWNLVGYPSSTKYNRSEGLNNLEFGPDVDCIQWYDAATQSWHFMGPDDHFSPGRGYWVHAKVEAGWEVPL